METRGLGVHRAVQRGGRKEGAEVGSLKIKERSCERCHTKLYMTLSSSDHDLPFVAIKMSGGTYLDTKKSKIRE